MMRITQQSSSRFWRHNQGLWKCYFANHFHLGRQQRAADLIYSRTDWLFWENILHGSANEVMVVEARELLRDIPTRQEMSWDFHVQSYAWNGNTLEAKRHFFKEYWTKNYFVNGYMDVSSLDEARRIFDNLLSEEEKKDPFCWSEMIRRYAWDGKMIEAIQLFEEAPVRNVYAWTYMVFGYASLGMLHTARRFFDDMPKKIPLSWDAIIMAYAQRGIMSEATKLLEESATGDAFAWTQVVSGYAENGMLDEARTFFDNMPEKNPFAWSEMIRGYMWNNVMSKARQLFDESPLTMKNAYAWTYMVAGYAEMGMVEEAKRYFDNMPEKTPVSWSAMIKCFAKNGDIHEARNLFDKMPCWDCVAWGTMIRAYAEEGDIEEASRLIVEMHRRDVGRRRLSVSSWYGIESALDACFDLVLGKQLHGHLIKAGFCPTKMSLADDALCEMYCRCGNVRDAEYVNCDMMLNRNPLDWLISSLKYIPNVRRNS